MKHLFLSKCYCTHHHKLTLNIVISGKFILNHFLHYSPDTPPREKNPSSGANEDVFINETYDDYYNAPLNSPLPKSFEHGYMPANVPANKQSLKGKIDNARNPLRATNIGIRSPSSSVGDCESPVPKPKGMHIPPHQPGFRHFLHEDSPRINTSAKDLHDKIL